MKLKSTDECVVVVDDGKYTFGLRNGTVTCLRHGEEWKGGVELEHSSAVAALVRELYSTRSTTLGVIHTARCAVTVRPDLPLMACDCGAGMKFLNMQAKAREEPGLDGTERKTHYGVGRQPWDDIVDTGGGPAFAAGNVLKYLRRVKHPEHSLESARWYWQQLKDRVTGKCNDHRDHAGWLRAQTKLILLLTEDELARLETRP